MYTDSMKVAVVGTGYVGLVSGACFAELGHEVLCVDIDKQKVAAMRSGQVPIYEPGLEELFARNAAAGRLRFTTQLAAAADHAEVIFLALPTPSGEDGSADLSYVLGVADQLGPLLQHYTVIVDKSTVPVGTSDLVRKRIAANATPAFDVVSNPEFLREGLAIADFMAPDRIVVGASSPQALKVMRSLYEPIVKKGHPLLEMDERSAELTKYAANSFLAMKITFMNEIANLSERLGANVDAVREGIGSDDRIGPRFLYPGIGYGGSCFPKDVQALLHTAHEYDYEFELIKAVIALNLRQQKLLTQKLLAYYGGNIRGKVFALWGLAFKPDTDDIRQAPAIAMAADLLAAGARVNVYDPEAMDNAKQALGTHPNLTFSPDALAALTDADALLVATEWPQFSEVPLATIKQLLKTPVIFDGRNIFSLQAAREAGVRYESVGRPLVDASLPQ